MSILSTILVCFSLSLDNGAVALASGCAGRQANKQIFMVCFFFVLAHIIMFSIGWFGGVEAGKYIHAYDHWVAFFLLLYIGGKMIKESFSKENRACSTDIFKQVKQLAIISIATSFDAFAVGISLSLTGASMLVSLAAMSFFVFLTSFLGFTLGSKLGAKFGNKMEAFGGAVLVVIGIKILLDGLK